MISSKPAGLIDAITFRIKNSLPWLPQEGFSHEDWYVLEDYSALGPLNDAVVQGESGRLHSLLAKDYMKGAGAILKAIMQEIVLDEARLPLGSRNRPARHTILTTNK